jgi:KDO2-lipid IV(A) lauroyltransferase
VSAAARDGVAAARYRSRPLRRVAFRLLDIGLAVGRLLPDTLVYRLAYAAGIAASRVLPARRLVVRANLVRVCGWLVANGLASPAVQAATRDPRRLEALVRATFGHWVVSYAESALAPRYDADTLRGRIRALHPESASQALAKPAPGSVGSIQLAMHFGSVDLSGLYATRVAGRRVIAPMEQVSDPDARAWFERVRGALGVTIVPIAGAGEALTEALEQGEMVGLVADRIIGQGRGGRVELFGAPARLPLGPAALAVRTGAPMWLQAVERTARGRWVGHTVPIAAEPGLTGRAAVRSLLEAEARAFERIVARAPEQWSTLLFPIWDAERPS